MLELFMVLFFTALLFFIVFTFRELSKSNREKTEKEVAEKIKQAGGQLINIEFVSLERDETIYRVEYLDHQGNKQEPIVRIRKASAFAEREMIWTQSAEPSALSSTSSEPSTVSSTKEQIISDMSDEIERLQAELAEARQDSADK